MDLGRPIEELAAAVAGGTISAESLVQASLDAIGKAESFHTVLELNPAAVDRARQINEQVKAGKKVGRLAGVPFIAKDNFLTAHTHTTAASHILEPFRAPYQATAIQKLEAEGAVLVAKANLDAFGHGSSTENSDFGPTKNPWDPAKVPGGSSGGSAAAVALGLASFAIGTDTGGSIRLPAGFCGVVGLKPTYGLVSRYGVVAMASSTDTIGPITRRVSDAALVLGVLAGPDVADATTIKGAASYIADKSDPKGLKVGVVKELIKAEGLSPEVKNSINAAIDQLKTAGAEVTEFSLPAIDLALACYYIIVPAEISSNLSRYDGIKYGHSAKEAQTLAETYALSRDQGFGAETKRRILIGTYVLSSGYYDAYYKKAQTVRTKLIEEFDEAFGRFDVLLGPTAATTAFDLGAKAADPLAMYATDIMTVAPSLVGCPAISLPSGLGSGNLPIGLQLIGPQRGEVQLLAAAAGLERLINFTAKPAELVR